MEKAKFDIPRAFGSCKKCKWVGMMDSQGPQGPQQTLVCHKEPPKVFAIAIPRPNPQNPQEQGIQWMSTAAWPDVQDHDWCGSFTPRDVN